jgi:phosphatidylserine/phosphatidylglycerophosphate/cardiolipin synthase-like enzyme
LSTSYTLPAGGLQAVRANFRSGGSAAVCTTGSYDDHDDLIFAVQSTGTSSFSLSATAASVTDGSTGTSAVTEAISNGFSSPVTLSASGLPTGVTAAFSPTSITGAGTSTLTFTASSTATPGTYTVTVTGTPASGTAETTPLTLTVSAETSTTYTLIAEPAQGLTSIYNLISSAKKTIDMTMYELTDTTVTSLLATAAADGVTVRVILDQNSEKSSNTTAYNYLSENNVSVHWANPVYTVTHQKTITVDQTTSAIMTLNLTPNYYSTSRDYAVITDDAADVAAIETTFDADFVNGTITPPDGDNLVWSPTNSRSALLALINGATTSLMIEQEEMSDTGIESALESALARGVEITLVQENESSDYNTILTTLKNDGAKIAVYTSSTGYYIHAKVILADYGTSTAKLFVGSENFSSNSLNNNRELGLIFSDAASMTAIEPDIVSDYNGGTEY